MGGLLSLQALYVGLRLCDLHALRLGDALLGLLLTIALRILLRQRETARILGTRWVIIPCEAPGARHDPIGFIGRLCRLMLRKQRRIFLREKQRLRLDRGLVLAALLSKGLEIAKPVLTPRHDAAGLTGLPALRRVIPDAIDIPRIIAALSIAISRNRAEPYRVRQARLLHRADKLVFDFVGLSKRSNRCRGAPMA